MKQLLTIIFTLASVTVFSQIEFEPGYFIDNSGDSTRCLIRNEDWRDTPIGFRYKISEDSKLDSKGANDVKEFGIFNEARYISRSLDVYLRSHKLENLSEEISPSFEKKRIFLKTLVDGEASLYEYKDSDIVRFFFSSSGSEVKQLIYKPYRVEDRVNYNNAFRQQLMAVLQCSDLSLLEFTNLEYDYYDLMDILIKYNKCEDSPYLKYEKKNNPVIHLTVRPGTRFTHMYSYVRPISGRPDLEIDHGGKLGVRVGVEFELILPFNKNKWALALEPVYQTFESTNRVSAFFLAENEADVMVDYQSIEVPISLRHYLYLTPESKLFINGSCYADFALNSSMKYIRLDGTTVASLDHNVSPVVSYGLGAGYKYKMFSAELRYQHARNLLNKISNWYTKYSTVSFIVGYSIF